MSSRRPIHESKFSKTNSRRPIQAKLTADTPPIRKSTVIGEYATNNDERNGLLTGKLLGGL